MNIFDSLTEAVILKEEKEVTYFFKISKIDILR